MWTLDHHNREDILLIEADGRRSEAKKLVAELEEVDRGQVPWQEGCILCSQAHPMTLLEKQLVNFLRLRGVYKPSRDSKILTPPPPPSPPTCSPPILAIPMAPGDI